MTRHHYDEDGRLVASVEQTESPWADPEQFTQIEALYVYDASLCGACGRPLDECRDPNAAVMVDDEVCAYTRAVEVARRAIAAKHKDEKPKPGRPLWSDGLLLAGRPMTDLEFEKYSGRQRLHRD